MQLTSNLYRFGTDLQTPLMQRLIGRLGTKHAN